MMSEKIDNGSENGYLKLCEVTPNEYENICWPGLPVAIEGKRA